MTRPPFYDWVSTKTIYIGGGRAFVPGSLVPDTTVTANGWDLDGTCIPATPPPDPSVTPSTMIVSAWEVT